MSATPRGSDRRAGDPEIDHPSYYGGENNPHEAIKCIEGAKLGFVLGTAVKYIWRAGKKNGESTVKDLKKAIWYIERRIEQIEKGTDVD